MMEHSNQSLLNRSLKGLIHVHDDHFYFCAMMAQIVRNSVFPTIWVDSIGIWVSTFAIMFPWMSSLWLLIFRLVGSIILRSLVTLISIDKWVPFGKPLSTRTNIPPSAILKNRWSFRHLKMTNGLNSITMDFLRFLATSWKDLRCHEASPRSAKRYRYPSLQLLSP